jgi:hypothetical protein
MAKIERLRPATHQKAADAIQLLLDLGLPLAPETKANLLDAFVAFRPEPWPFIRVNPASWSDCWRRCGGGRVARCTTELERLSVTGRWLRPTGKLGKKYKLLSEAQREAAIARDRGSVVRIVRVTDDGSRMVVEE